MLSHQTFCRGQDFSIKNVQNLVKIGSFSNCFIYATNQGKNDIDPLLEIIEIAAYIYNNISCHAIKIFLLTSVFFEE